MGDRPASSDATSAATLRSARRMAMEAASIPGVMLQSNQASDVALVAATRHDAAFMCKLSHRNMSKAVTAIAFVLPTAVSIGLLFLPPETSAGGQFRYFESVLLLNIPLVTLHAVVTLPTSIADDKRLLQGARGSGIVQRCLQRAACIDPTLLHGTATSSAAAAADDDNDDDHNFGVNVQQARQRWIALPGPGILLHLASIAVAMVCASLYPYPVSGMIHNPVVTSISPFLFVLVGWYLLLSLRVYILRNFPTERRHFIARAVSNFWVCIFVECTFLVFYLVWWSSLQLSFAPYFDKDTAKRQNCTKEIIPGIWIVADGPTSTAPKNDSMSEWISGETDARVVQMMRPRILAIVALSSHAVIIHCGLLFLFQTVMYGVRAVPVARLLQGSLPLSLSLQCLLLLIGTITTLFRLFRDN